MTQGHREVNLPKVTEIIKIIIGRTKVKNPDLPDLKAALATLRNSHTKCYIMTISLGNT